MSGHPAHLVFVDFENVPTFDLDAIAPLAVFVTVLIGKTQTKIDMKLALQVSRHASKVALIQTDVAGRNALDLILAYHLGRAAASSPGSTLHVVSRDKDFDPLLAHLASAHVAASRCASFGELPFLPSAAARTTPKKKTAPKKKTPAASITATSAPIDASDEVLEKLVTRLRTDGSPRPKTKKSLLSHISNCYGNRLSETELNQKIDSLAAAGLLTIGSNNAITYQSQIPTPMSPKPPAAS